MLAASKRIVVNRFRRQQAASHERLLRLDQRRISVVGHFAGELQLLAECDGRNVCDKADILGDNVKLCSV